MSLSALIMAAALLAPSAHAAEPVRIATTERGAWSARAQAGFPWSAVNGQVGLGPRLGLEADLHTALFRRWDAQAGPTLTVVSAPRFELQAAVLAGAVVQPGNDTGGARLSGPQLEAGLRAAVPGRVTPWITLASQHLLAVETTVRTDAEGSTTERGTTHLWTPWLGLGAALPISERVAVEAGLDVTRTDGRFSIPGAHAALRLRGAP